MLMHVYEVNKHVIFQKFSTEHFNFCLSGSMELHVSQKHYLTRVFFFRYATTKMIIEMKQLHKEKPSAVLIMRKCP